MTASDDFVRKSVAESIMNTVSDLNRSGLVDDITMRNIGQLCLPNVQEYIPAQIVSIRRKFKLSQAASCQYFQYQSVHGAEVGTGAEEACWGIKEAAGVNGEEGD